MYLVSFNRNNSKPYSLYRIHKALLHLIENHDAKSKYHNHNDKTISQPTPANKLYHPTS